MPVERGYDSQVMPRAGAMGAMTSPDDYGAGLAGAVGQAAQGVHQRQIRAYQLDRKEAADQQVAQFNRDFAVYRQQRDQLEIDRRNSGYKGYAADLAKADQDAWERLSAGITEQDVQRQARARFDEFSTSAHSRALDYEEGQRIADNVLSDHDAYQTATGRVYGDPSRYGEELTQAYAAIDARKLPDDVKAKMRDKWEAGLATSRVESMVQSDPVQSKLELATGVYDFLGGQELDRLNRAADVEIHSREVAARTAAAAQVHQLNGQISAAAELANKGQPQDDNVLATLERQVVDDPGKLLQIKEARATNNVIVRYARASVEVMTADLAQIDAKIAREGAGVDPAITFTRNALQKRIDAKRQDVANDPGGEAARLGMAVQPIDFASPAAGAIQQRIATQEAVAQANRVPPQYFLPDEVREYQASARQGIEGKLDALDAAARFGGQRAYIAARQLAPSDEVFVYLAGLPEATRRVALHGREEVKNLPKDPPNARLKAQYATLDASLRRAVGRWDASQRQAVLEVTDAIEAQHRARGDRPGITSRTYAINLALGGYMANGVWHGGMANWNDDYFVLPRGMSKGQFEDKAKAQAVANGPVNPDGTPAAFSASRRPVQVGPSHYAFEARDGKPLRRRDGSLFVVDVSK